MTRKTQNSHLKLVTPELVGQQRERRQEEEQDETRKPAKWRARKIRRDIETLAAGLQFGLPALADPDLEVVDVIPHWPTVLFNPSINDCFDRLDNRLQEDGRNELRELNGSVTGAAFVVGIFAGRVFQGASKQEIDRMEADLVRAITARDRQRKS